MTDGYQNLVWLIDREIAYEISRCRRNLWFNILVDNICRITQKFNITPKQAMEIFNFPLESKDVSPFVDEHFRKEIEEGVAFAEKELWQKSIRAVMKNFNLPVEEAMTILEVPEEKQTEYADRI